MKPDALFPKSSGRDEEDPGADKPALKVVIISESVRAGERARRRVDCLLGAIAGAPEVETDLWGFEEVGHPELCEQARAQAEQADIILLSADGDGLPAPILDWVERCLPRKGERPGALVALLGDNKPAPGLMPGAGEYLRQKAGAAGLDFFCEVVPGRDPAWESGSRATLDRPGGGSPVIWVDKPEALACQGCGIND